MSTTITQFPYQREKQRILMPMTGTCVVAHGQNGRAAMAIALTSQSDLTGDGVQKDAASFRTEVNGGPYVRVYGPAGRYFDLTTLHVLGVTAEAAPADDRPASPLRPPVEPHPEEALAASDNRPVANQPPMTARKGKHNK